MVHDGEQGEANTCDPSSHLMSPVLGPGKVTWSPCSDQELASFLTGPDTKIQVEISLKIFLKVIAGHRLQVGF